MRSTAGGNRLFYPTGLELSRQPSVTIVCGSRQNRDMRSPRRKTTPGMRSASMQAGGLRSSPSLTQRTSTALPSSPESTQQPQIGPLWLLGECLLDYRCVWPRSSGLHASGFVVHQSLVPCPSTHSLLTFMPIFSFCRGSSRTHLQDLQALTKLVRDMQQRLPAGTPDSGLEQQVRVCRPDGGDHLHGG